MKYQYTFDDAGNRTEMKYFDGSITTTTTYYNNDLNQMYRRSLGPDWNYAYDDNGNLTDERTEGSYLRDLTWNEDNRLTYVDNIEDEDEVEYTYDPMGRRIMRKDVDNFRGQTLQEEITSQKCLTPTFRRIPVIAERKKIGAGSWSYSCIIQPRRE